MQRLSWKTGNQLFYPMLVVFTILCWKLAFSETAKEYFAYSTFQQKKEMDNVPDNIILLRKREVAADSLMNSYRLDSLRWRDSLWLKSTEIAFAKRLKVNYKYDSKFFLDSVNEKLAYQTITYSGDFSAQLALLDSLEHASYIGHVCAVVIQNVETRGIVVDKSLLTMRVVFSIIKK